MQTRTVTDGQPPVDIRRSRVRRAGRTAVLVAVAGTSILTLSGCSLAWTSMARLPHAETSSSARPATSTAAATAAPVAAVPAPEPAAATAPATASAQPAVPAGDLATGSTTHVLPAGASQLAVDYWTTDAPAELGSATTTTVQLSAHLEGAGAATETRVSRFRATTAPTTVQQDGAGPAATVLLDDAGSFSLTAPFSYSTAFQVPTSGVGSTTTVRLQWDLLVETEPGSDVWFRQTVLDQLVITLPAATTATATPGASS